MIGTVYRVLLEFIIIACRNMQSTRPSSGFVVFVCVSGAQLLVILSASISSMGWLVIGWMNSLVRLPVAISFFLHCGTRCGYDVSKVQENLSLTNTCLCFRWLRKDICKGGGKPARVGDLNLSPVTRADYLLLMWQRGFWFVQPISVCVSWTIRNIPALRNSQVIEAK